MFPNREPLANCDELEALDNYLTLMDVKEWQDLPKRVTTTSQRTHIIDASK